MSTNQNTTTDELERIVENQAERIEELEKQLGDLKEQVGQPTPGDVEVGRRGVLATLLGAGSAGLLGGRYMAQNARAATASGYVRTGELRDGNGNALATLNNGGPVDFPQGISTVELTADNVVVTQAEAGNLATHTGDLVPVSGSSWHTIFDFAGTVDVVSGQIYGYKPYGLRVTWNDDTTDTIQSTSNRRGFDDAGDGFGVVVVPAIKDASKLEVYNLSAQEADFGYHVTTI